MQGVRAGSSRTESTGSLPNGVTGSGSATETSGAGGFRYRIQQIALGLFWLLTAASVAGYATFGRHPEMLSGVPNGAATYAAAFTFFPRAHVLLGFFVLVLALVLHARWRWVTAFVAVYLISLASELAGTTVGLPFGPYHYSGGLGNKWFGHVPVLIPLSWFFMALPSYLLARRALAPGARGGRRGAALGILVGSFVLLAWDLALDPAMSGVTKYWVWGNEGPYYGMPLLNLFGWYVTGIALMAALWAFGADEWGATLGSGWLLSFYLANLALPLGMIAAAGLWGAVAVSIVGVGLSLVLPRYLSVRRDVAELLGATPRSIA